jgi:hypothetical protein
MYVNLMIISIRERFISKKLPTANRLITSKITLTLRKNDGKKSQIKDVIMRRENDVFR